ncbi:MAG: pilus assembly protein N-terminal domain-containing protein [bacterium]|nr:pilus assembly protein N-terminal domain-containing protein [bacterium]
MKKSIILLIVLFILSIVSAKFLKASAEPVAQVVKNQGDYKTTNINPYKDTNEKLYAVCGKTQLIKFDEPVKRISLTDPNLADIVLLSPKELLLNGKKAGRTSLIFWGNGDKPVFFNLIVQQDTDAFVQAVSKIAPNEDIHYTFTDDGVIMSGHISSSTVKKNIEEVIKAYNIKLLDITESLTKQVLLEVKITEATRNFTKTLSSEFGVGEYFYNNFNPGQGVVTGLGNFAAGQFSSGTGSFVFGSSSAKLGWHLQAAEEKGLIKILAEPKLLAIDGKPGSFNVGQEIPYPASIGLSSTTSYSFKNTGVILNFTPTILEKSNRIVLKLSPEISEIDESYQSAATGAPPGFKTRKVDTTVELADGETLIIAGLLNHKSTSADKKIPLLGDIPGLGFLFSSLSRTKVDTELVIFITPRIVEVDKNGQNL